MNNVIIVNYTHIWNHNINKVEVKSPKEELQCPIYVSHSWQNVGTKSTVISISDEHIAILNFTGILNGTLKNFYTD